MIKCAREIFWSLDVLTKRNIQIKLILMVCLESCHNVNNLEIGGSDIRLLLLSNSVQIQSISLIQNQIKKQIRFFPKQWILEIDVSLSNRTSKQTNKKESYTKNTEQQREEKNLLYFSTNAKKYTKYFGSHFSSLVHFIFIIC